MGPGNSEGSDRPPVDRIRLKRTDVEELKREIEHHEELGFRQVGAIGQVLVGDAVVFWVRMEQTG